jgi:hypothetical protein
LEGHLLAQGFAQSGNEELDLMLLEYGWIMARKCHEPLGKVINGAAAPE